MPQAPNLIRLLIGVTRASESTAFPNTVDRLSSRFRGLDDTKDSPKPTVDHNEDDKTIEELLAELGPEEQWNLNPDDATGVQILVNGAQDAISKNGKQDTEDERLEKQRKDPKEDKVPAADAVDLGKALEMAKAMLVASKEEVVDDEEAEYLIAQLMDEVNLETCQDDTDKPDGKEEDTLAGTHSDSARIYVDYGSLELPSTPTSQPVYKAVGSSVPTFPSAPTSAPSAERRATNQATRKPVTKETYTDQDIDTWCVICCDDATLKCMGCDGDLYCKNCWKEGHTGQDTGLEEKGHRAIEIRRMGMAS